MSIPPSHPSIPSVPPETNSNLFSSEVEVSLGSVLQVFDRWKRLKTHPSSSNPFDDLTTTHTDDIQWLSNELQEAIANILEDLKDLSETIQAVEAQPSRFKLTEKEVKERKEFVVKTKETVRNIKLAVVSDDPSLMPSSTPASSKHAYPPMNSKQAKELQDRNRLMGSSSPSLGRKNFFGPPEPVNKNAQDRFIEREQRMQQQIIEEQDGHLEDVMGTVSNLREVAIVMGRELDDQARLLDELETDVETTAGKLKMGLRRMKEFIDANADSKQQWTICGLISLLVFLLFIVTII
ncbi:Syntaxin-10 [Phlyctochytrium planicorne]|nr:Syntaxin-10 [Phlyctochytrium planicorne]